MKEGNTEAVKLARIREIFDLGTGLIEQIAAMVYEAWTILLNDGVWKVRIPPGAGTGYLLVWLCDMRC